MKATGIVRRIDDLGRVVVPKEIRRTLRIREGDLSLITLAENAENREILQRLRKEQFVKGIVEFASRINVESK